MASFTASLPSQKILQLSGPALITPSLSLTYSLSFSLSRSNPLIKATDSTYLLTIHSERILITHSLLLSFPQ